MCERKVEREELRKKELKHNMASAPKVDKEEDEADIDVDHPKDDFKIDVRSESTQEIEDHFTYRHKYLLKKAEDFCRVGDFVGSHQYCEKGLELLPKSKVFSRAKEKAFDGILISLGRKSPTAEMAEKFLVVELLKAQELYDKKRYQEAIDHCLVLIDDVKAMPLQKINNKDSLIATAISVIGNSYLALDNTEKALFYHLQDLDAGKDLQNRTIELRALGNIGIVHVKMKDYTKAAKVWQQAFDMGLEDDEERAWLCYELGQCYLELNNYQKAIDMGEHSLHSATKGNVSKYKIYASILIGNAGLRGGAVDVARTGFEKALGFATAARDKESIAIIKPVLIELDKVPKDKSKTENE